MYIHLVREHSFVPKIILSKKNNPQTKSISKYPTGCSLYFSFLGPYLSEMIDDLLVIFNLKLFIPSFSFIYMSFFFQ